MNEKVDQDTLAVLSDALTRLAPKNTPTEIIQNHSQSLLEINDRLARDLKKMLDQNAPMVGFAVSYIAKPSAEYIGRIQVQQKMNLLHATAILDDAWSATGGYVQSSIEVKKRLTEAFADRSAEEKFHVAIVTKAKTHDDSYSLYDALKDAIAAHKTKPQGKGESPEDLTQRPAQVIAV